ncbi:hypothetical protein NQ314_020339 [Rhamnusium bicolor]|uniref:FHA domain-containing protein n=1 Tax=Rhamnusium bicolor TaxID=1586634 RepID=A0AAV8WLQ4_9CUCU|nr:hypothetical protein NQ314_020339 [Rhamnusium bicolor]
MVDFENPKLRCESGAVIELNSNPFSIGRGLSCNYVITRKAVSRVHCIMEKNDNTWILKDTSTNGSFVNGKLIKGVKSPPLKEGDLIKLDLDGEYYIFEMETGNRADDISDEQLCSFADTVLSEVEAFQQETHNQENNDPFINGMYILMPKA